jgi:putative transposase
MPEHVHLLVQPRCPSYDISQFLFTVKRSVSGRARLFLEDRDKDKWLERLTVHEGDDTVFRFWKPGGGFDRNVRERTAVPALIGYIHANPVRRGLVDAPTEWRWSSAGWWVSGQSGPVSMAPINLDP